MRILTGTLLVLIVMVSSAPAQEGSVPPSPIDSLAMGPVAVIGHNRIGADLVFELWTPVWYETLAKVRNGKMSIEEGDARLNEEWQRAIFALVKDELFFQEAEREHNSFINMVVDSIMRQGSDRPRMQVTTEVRRAMEQQMEKHFRLLNAELVKETGGMVKLHKVLESRGLTYIEWQNRLKKKAFTQSYLHEILKPRAPAPGPKQIQSYYSSHPAEFSRPGVVRFRHIFFSNAQRGADQARDDAVEVWERLVDGEIGFEEAAAQYSDDEESKTRGGLESAEEAVDPEREAWLSDIRTALREEKPGEIGPILESPFGCHVATLIAIGPERKIPFSEVRRDIDRKLQAKIWEEETDRYFASIRKNVDIKVVMPTFPPYLSCAAQAGFGARTPTVYNTALPKMAPRQPRGRR